MGFKCSGSWQVSRGYERTPIGSNCSPDMGDPLRVQLLLKPGLANEIHLLVLWKLEDLLDVDC